MPELPTPSQERIRSIAQAHMTTLMEELNDLHTESLVPDEEIVDALRGGGYGDVADQYEDWIADEDPARKVNQPDPEGPGGYVTDPPSDVYAELEKQLNDQRDAQNITYNWSERERLMYSCRATVNREAFQRWLDERYGPGTDVEEIDGGYIVDYLEANPGVSIDERRWPADESEVDVFDLTIVQP